GRAGEFVFEIAADDRRAVQDANAVVVGRVLTEAHRPVHRVDREELFDRADEAGFLFELAQRRRFWVLAELDAAARQGRGSGRPRNGGETAEQQPAGGIDADVVGRDALDLADPAHLNGSTARPAALRSRRCLLTRR